MDLYKLLHVSKCSFRVLLVILTNIYCIPTYIIWMWVIFLPLRILNLPGYWYMEGVMYKWLLCMVASWSWEAQLYIMEIGEDISSCIDQRCLLLVNHQSTADVPLLMAAFHEKGPVLPSLMWIMDRMFRYTNFGAVSVTHGDYFITQWSAGKPTLSKKTELSKVLSDNENRKVDEMARNQFPGYFNYLHEKYRKIASFFMGKNVREIQMQKLTDHLLNVYLVRNRQWIVLFPEGGFLSKRKETSAKYARENNFPNLQRVTLPRVGAIQVILNTLTPQKLKDVIAERSPRVLLEHMSQPQNAGKPLEPLKWLIDVTVAYPDIQNPLDLLAICTASRPTCTTYIHYRRYPIEDVPLDSMESLRDWVYARWVEKEELLNAFYSTGDFPHLPSSLSTGNSEQIVHRKHPVLLSNLWIGFLHMFFLSSSFFHCYILRRLWSFIY